MIHSIGRNNGTELMTAREAMILCIGAAAAILLMIGLSELCMWFYARGRTDQILADLNSHIGKADGGRFSQGSVGRRDGEYGGADLADNKSVQDTTQD